MYSGIETVRNLEFKGLSAADHNKTRFERVFAILLRLPVSPSAHMCACYFLPPMIISAHVLLAPSEITHPTHCMLFCPFLMSLTSFFWCRLSLPFRIFAQASDIEIGPLVGEEGIAIDNPSDSQPDEAGGVSTRRAGSVSTRLASSTRRASSDKIEFPLILSCINEAECSDHSSRLQKHVWFCENNFFLRWCARMYLRLKLKHARNYARSHYWNMTTTLVCCGF